VLFIGERFKRLNVKLNFSCGDSSSFNFFVLSSNIYRNMSNKILWIGLLTLIGFPLVGYLIRYGFSPNELSDFMQIQHFGAIPVGYGAMLGFVYAFIALAFMNSMVFEGLDNRVERVIEQLRIGFWGGIFLSVCAGLGEELFFRASLQPYLGIWITSVLFVAIHGYLNPWNWRMSLYGLMILPFIFLLSFGFDRFGLWFAVAAHFAYDAVLFTAMTRENVNTAPTR